MTSEKYVLKFDDDEHQEYISVDPDSGNYETSHHINDARRYNSLSLARLGILALRFNNIKTPVVVLRIEILDVYRDNGDRVLVAGEDDS